MPEREGKGVGSETEGKMGQSLTVVPSMVALLTEEKMVSTEAIKEKKAW